jgi:hypothetical protein
MENAVLSRMCSRALVTALEIAAIDGFTDGSFRLRFVRGGRLTGQRSSVSHVIYSWEGGDGVSATARRCMCGQIERPDC